MSHPPANPPPFDQPKIRKCIKTNVRIQNQEELQEVLILTTVLCSVESELNRNATTTTTTTINIAAVDNNEATTFQPSDSSGSDEEMYSDSSSSDDSRGYSESERNINEEPQDRGEEERQHHRMKAFWLRKDPICENHHGIWTTYIYYATVLQKADLYWVSTDNEVAIKAVSWQCVREAQNRLSEDFIKEISALEYLSQWRESEGKSITDAHVMTADTVMCDECCLYIVMPFCRGGDLMQRVAEVERFSEDVSRFWFRQILQGLETLQRARVTHRDLSPENLLIIDDNALVIDFGMCLRIPYINNVRHLISPQNPCGKLPHMSPEIYRRKAFDGHAIDLWAAGTVLLFMLTGKRLSNPPLIDRAFDGVDLGLSNEATDLLRKMFRLDPKDRLTLQQILVHPFVTC